MLQLVRCKHNMTDLSVKVFIEFYAQIRSILDTGNTSDYMSLPETQFSPILELDKSKKD